MPKTKSQSLSDCDDLACSENRLNFDLVIVGGGLVGAVAALGFAKFAPSSFKIGLSERHSFEALQRPSGRAYAISHSSKTLLDMIGVWDDIVPHAQAISEIDITDSELDSPFRPVFLNFSGEIAMGEPGSYIIEHDALAGPIYKALLASSGLSLFENSEIGSLKEASCGLDFSINDQLVRAKLLIGADGRQSFVRREAGIEVFHADYEQDGIVVTVALSKAHQGKAVQHFLPSGPFAILPLKGDRASLVWTEERGLAKEMCTLSDEKFIQEINQRFSPKLGTVTLAGPRAHFPLSLQIAHSFIAPRIALIGDAAHGVHPLAGQGMNIGFRDVAALIEVVLETHRLGLDFGDQTALERYQQWRRFDAVVSAFVMDGINRTFINKSQFIREVRGFGLRLVDRLPPLKDFFVKEAAGVNGDMPLLMQGKPLV